MSEFGWFARSDARGFAQKIQLGRRERRKSAVAIEKKVSQIFREERSAIANESEENNSRDFERQEEDKDMLSERRKFGKAERGKPGGRDRREETSDKAAEAREQEDGWFVSGRRIGKSVVGDKGKEEEDKETRHCGQLVANNREMTRIADFSKGDCV